MTTEIKPDALYTPAEVAEILRCGRTNVYTLVGKDLTMTRVGTGRKGFRIKGSDLLAFMESRKEGGPPRKASFKRLGL